MSFKFNPITNRLDIIGTSGSGGGDVSGPGSSTNNAIVRWSGTTGTLIKNSTATLSDTGDIVANSIDLTVPVAVVDGGTGFSTTVTGDILYADASNSLAKLPIGTSSQVLTVSGGLPVWATAASGGVTSVSGTANRITSTGGTTPVIDIDATYVGQTSITTLGTIATGTWNGSTIDVSHGGTGQTTLTNHGVLVGAGTSVITQLAAGTAGQVLQSGGAAADPLYSTATYPSTATGTGTILRANGTNWVASTATYPNTVTTGDLLYASASNVLSNLATVNNSALTTNSSGVPTWPTPPTLTTGQLQWAHGVPVIGTASNRFYVYDDMINKNYYQNNTANGGGTDNPDVDNNHPGCIYIQTGNSSSSGAAQISFYGSNVHYLPNGKTYFETLVLVQDLATALQDYSFYAGMSDAFTSGTPSNGVYFEYTRATNTNWLIVTKSGGSATSASSGVTVNGNWVKLAWYYDPTAPLVTFYINGSSVGTSSTNIPTSNLIGINWAIIKSVGTTNARISMDYFEMFSLLTNTR